MIKLFHRKASALIIPILFLLSTLIVVSQTPAPSSINTPDNSTTPPSLQVSPPEQASPKTTLSESPKPDDKGVNFGEILKLIIPQLWILVLIAAVAFLLFAYRKDLSTLISRIANNASQLEIANAKLHIDKNIGDEAKDEPSNEKAQPPLQQNEGAENLLEKKISPENEESKSLLLKMLEAFLDSESLEQLEEAYKSLQANETDENERIMNERLYLSFRFRRGDTTAIDKLNNLAKRDEGKGLTYNTLGLLYAENNNFEKAKEHFELALEQAKTELDKANNIISIANTYYKAGKREEAFSTLQKAINKTTDEEALTELYKDLAQLYKKDDDTWLRALALEKAVEFSPNNTELIFDLAYAYADLKEYDLSILHYLALLRFQPKNDSALNNLGVAYDKINLPIHSVEAYKKSADLNNTLASANLAYRLINAGFSKEALEILDKAKTQENSHPNVGSAIAELASQQESENKKTEELRESALKQQYFLREYAEKYFYNQEIKINLNGKWSFEDGLETEITQTGKEFEFFQDEILKTYKFKGTLYNLTASMSRLEKNIYSTLLEPSYAFDKGARAYIAEDGTQISILINGEPPIVLKLNKKLVTNGEDQSPKNPE
jgi:tetratricopeptide (TPR) repeat protein